MNKKYWIVNQINSSVAEILLYGDIYPFEDCANAKSFATELKELEKTCSKINVRINSNGGSVFEGIAIFNAIKNSKCEIDTYIDGIAASMGSVIAMAGNKLFMSKYARLMTHKPSGGAYGSSDELRRTAKEIDECEKILNAIYVVKTGLTEQEVSERFLNGKDMYFSAEEAKREKLIDEIYDGEPVELPENTNDRDKIWSAYNAKLQNKATSKPLTGNYLIATMHGVLEVKDGAYVIGDSRTTATVSQPVAAKKVEFPDDMFRAWDDLIESGDLEKIREEDITLYAAIYSFEFSKKQFEEWNSITRVNPALFEVYYDELVRRRVKYLMSLSVDDLFYGDLFKELQKRDRQSFEKKWKEYQKQYE